MTDSAGHFVLKDVPAGDNIPVVAQIGKWRRKIVLPHVEACTDTKLDDAALKLPGKQADGDMPQMAIATGKADPFECLLLKIGIDPSEFTLPNGPGRIHYFQSWAGGGDGAGRPLASAATSTPHTDALCGSTDTLKQHDVVILPCEHGEYASYNASWRTNMLAYLNAGGRTFFTHYQDTWMKNASGDAAALASVASFDVQESDRSDKAGASATLLEDIWVDPSFPKGKIFADWLQNVQATTTYGKLPVTNWRHDVKTENHPPSQRWITADTRNGWTSAPPSVAGLTVPHFTFNAPMDEAPEKQCGKAVFSDFHVSAQEFKDGENGTLAFPDSCALNPLSPQEKALIFMLFDLNSCVQDESKAPTVPPVVK
ncbi:Tryptophan synthase alpha chain [Labilithrix luteola]|uniref:Tryptophan synthase alpha chain n=1 Tax=Labilithrix luteola TaxID=1391654 RepID=A0A0K1PSH7_9BACT|nr:Tryptophan synthase alpha chain [Labilithrix luteola]